MVLMTSPFTHGTMLTPKYCTLSTHHTAKSCAQVCNEGGHIWCVCYVCICICKYIDQHLYISLQSYLYTNDMHCVMYVFVPCTFYVCMYEYARVYARFHVCMSVKVDTFSASTLETHCRPNISENSTCKSTRSRHCCRFLFTGCTAENCQQSFNFLCEPRIFIRGR